MKHDRVGGWAVMTSVGRIVPVVALLLAAAPAQAQAPALDTALVLKGEGLFKEHGCYGCLYRGYDRLWLGYR